MRQILSRHSKNEHRYCVILAGGDGSSLRSLTRCVTLDERPKQFCPFLGRWTPLRATRRRAATRFDPERTLFVVTRAHERYYSQELSDVRPSQVLIQPENRGTAPAILLSLMHLNQLDPEASVAFLPSDHYYDDEAGFLDGACRAFEAAEMRTKLAILLGATPTHAEADCGWIQPGPLIETADRSGLFRVIKFWEKPSRPEARILYNLSCLWNYLWNTFVMVGRVSVLLEMVQRSSPHLYESFAYQQTTGGHVDCERLYQTLKTVDFSRNILCKSPPELAVLDLGPVGWSDLGEPDRVVRLVSRIYSKCPWLETWRRSHGTATGPDLPAGERCR